jgi:hypothetical protein
MAACVLALAALTAVAEPAGVERFSTDWLTPPVQVRADLPDVCAIELDLDIDLDDVRGREKGSLDRFAGTIRLYSGTPTFDEFGDADKATLPSRTFTVTFRASTAPAKPGQGDLQGGNSGVLYELTNEAAPPGMQFVLSAVQPGDCRLLFIGPDGAIARVLPLQSERLRSQAERHPPSNPGRLSLHSDLFVGRGGSLSLITLGGVTDYLLFELDPNRFQLNRLGDIYVSTAMASLPWKCSLGELHVPDPAKQGRRLFRCDLTRHGEGSARDNTVFEEAFLVLHPCEGGWHRLILKKDGAVQRVLPMHSQSLYSWLAIRSQLTDAAELQVFDRISKRMPYFSGLTVTDDRVRGARLSSPSGKEAVVEDLAEFSQLTSLEIDGTLADGAPLERCVKLERIFFRGGRVSEDILRRVGRLPRLKSLFFYNTRVDCRGLAHLSGLRKLTHFGYWKGDAGEYAENYDDACVTVFAKLPELQWLELNALPLTDAAVDLLPMTERLTDVSFGRTVSLRAALAYGQAAPATNVELEGGRWRLADGEIWLPRSVTNDDLAAVGRVTNLHSLSMNDADAVTDEGLAHLQSLPLKHLSIMNAHHVTDAGLAHIATIKTLESLNLYCSSPFTTGAIADLKRLPNLKKITLHGTQIDRRAFQAAMPGCEIED